MNDEQERRARRRAVARELHPDRGGDPEAFDRALRALEEPAPTSHEIVLTPSHRTRAKRRAATIRRTAVARVERLLRTTRLTRRAP